MFDNDIEEDSVEQRHRPLSEIQTNQDENKFDTCRQFLDLQKDQQYYVDEDESDMQETSVNEQLSESETPQPQLGPIQPDFRTDGRFQGIVVPDTFNHRPFAPEQRGESEMRVVCHQTNQSNHTAQFQYYHEQ